MAKIENKVIFDKDLKAWWGERYSNAICKIMDSSPEGMTIGEMEKRLGIISQVKKVSGDSVIVLDKAEIQIIIDDLNKAKFTTAKIEIVQFKKDLVESIEKDSK